MYEDYFKRIEEECFIRNRKELTVKFYKYHVGCFLKWVGDKPAEELTLLDARNYILMLRKQGKAAVTCNGVNSALSFFYQRVLHKSWDYGEVPRMRRDWTLPEVLTLEEIEELINTATSIRNKAIIALLYSSGLRLSELVNLAPEDIYMSTMMVHVRNGKNHGDRWTILSEKALEYLKEYWATYPKKRDYLFVSLRAPHEQLRASGVETMLKKIGKEAGVGNHLHPHTLRHSFASHLLENDVAIQEIQTMMGHKSPATTSLYIHVTNKTLMGIKSPLDHPQKKKRGRKKKDEQ